MVFDRLIHGFFWPKAPEQENLLCNSCLLRGFHDPFRLSSGGLSFFEDKNYVMQERDRL